MCRCWCIYDCVVTIEGTVGAASLAGEGCNNNNNTTPPPPPGMQCRRSFIWNRKGGMNGYQFHELATAQHCGTGRVRHDFLLAGVGPERRGRSSRRRFIGRGDRGHRHVPRHEPDGHAGHHLGVDGHRPRATGRRGHHKPVSGDPRIELRQCHEHLAQGRGARDRPVPGPDVAGIDLCGQRTRHGHEHPAATASEFRPGAHRGAQGAAGHALRRRQHGGSDPLHHQEAQSGRLRLGVHGEDFGPGAFQ